VIWPHYWQARHDVIHVSTGAGGRGCKVAVKEPFNILGVIVSIKIIRFMNYFALTFLQTGINCSISFEVMCVQLYYRCFTVLRLVVAVLHYMFRPT
jgi:hypothetical protein